MKSFFRSVQLAVFICLFIGGGGVVPLHTAHAASLPRYERLFYYRDSFLAKSSFMRHPGSIDIFAPQAYSVDGSGALAGGVDPFLIAFAKDQHIRVMPVLTNRGFSTSTAAAILGDSAKQETLAAALVDEAKRYGYWGYQIDFEQMDAGNRDQYSAFVERVSALLKAHGLASSVAVMAHTSDNPADYPNNLWQRILGVYDYTTLASSTDFVSIMSYDDPISSGPVARYSWLEHVLSYSTEHIPKDKISLGIPLYYWQWEDVSGKRIGIGGRAGIEHVFKKHKVAVHYSAREQAPYLKYMSRKKNYTIWYENSRSIAKKISLIKKNNLRGFSAWALGLETASVYNAIR